MRKIIASGFIAALALSLTTPALAKTDAKAESATAEQGANGSNTAAVAQERKVCRMLEMTGARTKNKRVCLTRAEWNKVERDAL